MEKQNAYYIVWNSSKNNFNSIYGIIKNNTIIKNKKILDIKKYFEFICDIYAFNNQRELGVYKATKMCDNSKYEIMVIEVEFIIDEYGDYSLIKNLKKYIRNLYKYTTENYFHDNIIHSTDSFEEYEHVKKLFNNIHDYQ